MKKIANPLRYQLRQRMRSLYKTRMSQTPEPPTISPLGAYLFK
jgi:hypothetical protein